MYVIVMIGLCIFFSSHTTHAAENSRLLPALTRMTGLNGQDIYRKEKPNTYGWPSNIFRFGAFLSGTATVACIGFGCALPKTHFLDDHYKDTAWCGNDTTCQKNSIEDGKLVDSFYIVGLGSLLGSMVTGGFLLMANALQDNHFYGTSKEIKLSAQEAKRIKNAYVSSASSGSSIINPTLLAMLVRTIKEKSYRYHKKDLGYILSVAIAKTYGGISSGTIEWNNTEQSSVTYQLKDGTTLDGKLAQTHFDYHFKTPNGATYFDPKQYSAHMVEGTINAVTKLRFEVIDYESGS